MKHAHHNKAKHHMEKAEMHHEKAAKHHEMAKKAMGKVGSAKEEKSMAQKGDYKGNSAKKTNKPNESKK